MRVRGVVQFTVYIHIYIYINFYKIMLVSRVEDIFYAFDVDADADALAAAVTHPASTYTQLTGKCFLFNLQVD